MTVDPLSSDDVLNIMRAWIGALDPDQPPKEEAYLDLDAFEYKGQVRPLRGGSVRKNLFTTIRRSGPSSAQLFSGFRGTGKTTELRKLKKELEREDYLVFLINAGEWVNNQDAPSTSELALALSGAIRECHERHLKQTGLPIPQGPSIWEQMITFFKGLDIELTHIGIRTGSPIDLKYALRSGAKPFSEALEKQLAIRHGELQTFLYNEINKITEHAQRYAGLVILVDGLEKFDAGIDQAAAVYDRVARLFTNRHGIWKLPNCHVIYTVPPYLEHFSASVANIYTGSIRILPCIKVRGRQPKRLPNPAGLAAFRELLSLRIDDTQRLFGSQFNEATDLLATASGGHVRDFFSLVKTTILLADERLPLTVEDARRAIHERESPYNNIWEQNIYDLVQTIYKTPTKELPQGIGPALAVAMDQYLVLGYRNGDTWYDVHPLASTRFRAPEQPSTE